MLLCDDSVTFSFKYDGYQLSDSHRILHRHLHKEHERGLGVAASLAHWRSSQANYGKIDIPMVVESAHLELGDFAGHGRLDVDRDFVRLDLSDSFVLSDCVPFLFQDLRDRSFRD